MPTQILFSTPQEYIATGDESFFNLDAEYYLVFRDQKFYVLTGYLSLLTPNELEEVQFEDQWCHPKKDQGVGYMIGEAGDQYEILLTIMNNILFPLNFRMIEEVGKFCAKHADLIDLTEENNRVFVKVE